MYEKANASMQISRTVTSSPPAADPPACTIMFADTSAQARADMAMTAVPALPSSSAHRQATTVSTNAAADEIRIRISGVLLLLPFPDMVGFPQSRPFVSSSTRSRSRHPQ